MQHYTCRSSGESDQKSDEKKTQVTDKKSISTSNDFVNMPSSAKTSKTQTLQRSDLPRNVQQTCKASRGDKNFQYIPEEDMLEDF